MKTFLKLALVLLLILAVEAWGGYVKARALAPEAPQLGVDIDPPGWLCRWDEKFQCTIDI